MQRLRVDKGQTLVEVLIAMVVIAIGVSGLVAGLGGGIVAVRHAASTATAGALADQQMEGYRRITFALIGTTDTSGMDCIYKVSATCLPPADTAYDPTWKLDGVSTATCNGQNYCTPSRPFPLPPLAPRYRIDSYVSLACPLASQSSSPAVTGTVTAPVCSTTGLASACSPPASPCILPASNAVKVVTILVRDASNPPKTLVRVTSTFDPLTG